MGFCIFMIAKFEEERRPGNEIIFYCTVMRLINMAGIHLTLFVRRL